MPASLLALACAVGLAAPKPVALWHSYRADEANALEGLADRFNRTQDEYRLELLSIPYDAIAAKVSAAIPRGHGPDLFIFAHERLGGWAEAGLLAPVELPADRFLPGTAEAFLWKGRQLGAPLAFKTVALFYNRQLVSKPPATTDELVAMGAGLSSAADGRFALAYQSGDFYYHDVAIRTGAVCLQFQVPGSNSDGGKRSSQLVCCPCRQCGDCCQPFVMREPSLIL